MINLNQKNSLHKVDLEIAEIEKIPGYQMHSQYHMLLQYRKNMIETMKFVDGYARIIVHKEDLWFDKKGAVDLEFETIKSESSEVAMISAEPEKPSFISRIRGFLGSSTQN